MTWDEGLVGLLMNSARRKQGEWDTYAKHLTASREDASEIAKAKREGRKEGAAAEKYLDQSIELTIDIMKLKGYLKDSYGWTESDS